MQEDHPLRSCIAHDNTPDLHSLGKGGHPLHLSKHLPTVLARRVGTGPLAPTTSALEVACAPTAIVTTLAMDGRRNSGVRGVVVIPWTAAVGTSQAHTILSLELECFLQPKL